MNRPRKLLAVLGVVVAYCTILFALFGFAYGFGCWLEGAR